MLTEWSQRIGLADMDGTVVDVNFMPPEDAEDRAMVGLHFKTGGAHLHTSPTPTALRQLASALLDGADAMEASDD